MKPTQNRNYNQWKKKKKKKKRAAVEVQVNPEKVLYDSLIKLQEVIISNA